MKTRFQIKVHVNSFLWFVSKIVKLKLKTGDGKPGTVNWEGAGPTTGMAGQTYSAAAGGAVQR